MRKIRMASVALAFAVSVFAQQPPDKPPAPLQSGGTTTEKSPRDLAIEKATLDMIHKDYADAAEIYKGLLKETPTDAGLWNHLGIAYHQQAMLGDALKSYEKASRVDKKNGDAWNNMGTIYFQEKKWAKAIRAYKKAIALNSQVATYHSNMGIAYLNSNHVPQALESFNTALRLDREVFDHSGRVGTVLQDRSSNDQGKFFFVLAKSFAASGNAERCGYYLRKSRDEGYKGLDAAKNDPEFKRVLTDPVVREVLGLPAISPPPHTMGM
jgi:Tfp pilus assembly protein PilF